MSEGHSPRLTTPSLCRQCILERHHKGVSLHRAAHHMLPKILMALSPRGSISEGKLSFSFSNHLFVQEDVTTFHLSSDNDGLYQPNKSRVVPGYCHPGV